MELLTGLFTLGGVALGGLLNEIRTRHDLKTAQFRELYALRREVYTRALRQVEMVASQVAQWMTSAGDPDSKTYRPFWDALTAAYETLNEVRLIADGPEPVESMLQALREYRSVVERNERVLPDNSKPRAVMVRAFRQDLGMNP